MSVAWLAAALLVVETIFVSLCRAYYRPDARFRARSCYDAAGPADQRTETGWVQCWPDVCDVRHERAEQRQLLAASSLYRLVRRYTDERFQRARRSDKCAP